MKISDYRMTLTERLQWALGIALAFAFVFGPVTLILATGCSKIADRHTARAYAMEAMVSDLGTVEP